MATASDILVIPLEGDLDVASVPRVRSYLEQRIAEGCTRVILNLACTEYVDSLGMGLILATARRLADRGGQLSLICVSDDVYRMLCICRLVDFIPVRRNAPKPAIPALDPMVLPVWKSTMRVPAEQLQAARRRLEELLARTDLTPDEAFDLTLAGGEALGNAVDHTCAEGVLLTISAYPDRVVIEVTDCGDGFELPAGEEPPCGSSEGAPGEIERGRGIKLMRMLADAVDIRRKTTGCGTMVQLVKLFTPPAARAVAKD